MLRFTTILMFFFVLCTLFAIPQNFAAETGNTKYCTSISLENAATILGVSIDDLQTNNTDTMVSPDDIKKKTFKMPPYNCSIRSKSDFLKGISYIIYVYNDPGRALIEYNKMQNSYGTISKVDVVPGIGDETFWVSDNRFQRMVSIKKDVVIDVLNPKEFDLQKQIIRLILGNL